MEECQNGWQMELYFPLGGRLKKPRDSGLTMVLDKGLGPTALKDFLDMNSGYLDFLKFSFGTSLIYPVHILQEKIKLAREYLVDVYPGGTLFEIALEQKQLDNFLSRASQLGFTAIEISNGTLDFPQKIREEAVRKAKSMGFKVLTEVGKKDKKSPLSSSEMRRQIELDLLAGADKIIIEGRESGKGIGIYYEDGSVDLSLVEEIMLAVRDDEKILIWEAPLKSQQVALIKKFGPNVNLGNISVDEVLALETLRKGIRGDTFGLVLANMQPGSRDKKENIVGA